MKLRNKDTKKYLLSVAVCTFVAYVVLAIFLYGEIYYGIMWAICICLLNVITALIAWKLAKSDCKQALLILQLELNSLVLLFLMGVTFLSITDGTIAFLFALFFFILWGIFNLFTVGLSLAVYAFFQRKFANKITKKGG